MPNLFYPSLSTKQHDCAKSYQAQHRLIVVMMCVLLASMILAGCGQKGALYLPEDAPNNTQYIFYGNYHSDNQATSQSETSSKDSQDETIVNESDDSQGY